ncbi:hypothetical protein Dimus_013183, partial [Dionaea muscipula]
LFCQVLIGMDITMERKWYRQSAAHITVVAHFFGVLAIILMLGLLHFSGDIDPDSDVPARVFNVEILFDPSS